MAVEESASRARERDPGIETVNMGGHSSNDSCHELTFALTEHLDYSGPHLSNAIRYSQLWYVLFLSEVC